MDGRYMLQIIVISRHLCDSHNNNNNDNDNNNNNDHHNHHYHQHHQFCDWEDLVFDRSIVTSSVVEDYQLICSRFDL